MIEVFRSQTQAKTLLLDALNSPVLDESSIYGAPRSFLISKDRTELEAFNNNYQSKLKGSIQDNDKIFMENTSFPSLLLTRINEATPTTLKRVTKADNADKIIIDPTPINYTGDMGIIIKVSDDSWYYLEINSAYKFKDKLYNKIDTNTEFDVYWAHAITNPVVASTYLDPQKKVSTWTFIEYIYKYLPKMDNTERESILAMLKCSNDEDYKTAVDMLQYYNIKDDVSVIMEALRTSPSFSEVKRRTISGMSTAGKYLYFILGTPPDDLYYAGSNYNRNNPIAILEFYSKWQLAHPWNPTMPDLKETIKTYMKTEINSDYWWKRSFRDYSCNITIEDNNGQSLVNNTSNTYNTEKLNLANSIYRRYEKVLKSLHLTIVLNG